MQSKKEAIEILKAMLENAINCNPMYNVVIYHRKGMIRFIDSFGDTDLKYDETRKTVSYEDIKNSIDKNTDKHQKEMTQILNNLRDIASSSNATRVLLQDMRAMLSHHSVKQVFMESQCSHILGFDRHNGLLYKGDAGEDKVYPHNAFEYCPKCGSKLR